MVSAFQRSRSGFTLIETVMATSITALVFGGLSTLVVGSYRMVKQTFATAELASNVRLVREKLLFHTEPVSDGVVWSGLLSASAQVRGEDVLKDGVIRMAAKGTRIEGGAPVDQVIELNVAESDDGCHLVNEGASEGASRGRNGRSWLSPSAKFGYLRGRYADDRGYADDDDDFEDHFKLVKEDGNDILHFKFVASLNGAKRTERISVPVFSTFQGDSVESSSGKDKDHPGNGHAYGWYKNGKMD